MSGVFVGDGAVMLTKAIVETPPGLSNVLSSTGKGEGVDHIFCSLYNVVFMLLCAPDCCACRCDYPFAQAMKSVRS